MVHVCPTCGCVAYWRALEAGEDGRRRIAVNLRLADPERLWRRYPWTVSMGSIVSKTARIGDVSQTIGSDVMVVGKHGEDLFADEKGRYSR